MTDEPDNLTLRQLSLIREEMRQGFTKVLAEQARTNEHVGSVAATLVGVQRDIRSLRRQVNGLTDSVATLGIAVDDRTHRLDHIEKRVSLVDA